MALSTWLQDIYRYFCPMALTWLLFSVNNVLFSNLKVYTSVNITLIDIKCSVSLASFFSYLLLRRVLLEDLNNIIQVSAKFSTFLFSFRLIYSNGLLRPYGAPTDLKIEMVNTTYLNLLING